MNLKTRLAKIEATIDPNTCPVCARQRPTLEAAQATLAKVVTICSGNRQEALKLLRESVPDDAIRLGEMSACALPGHCPSCGADLDPRELTERVRELYGQAFAEHLALNPDDPAAANAGALRELQAWDFGYLASEMAR